MDTHRSGSSSDPFQSFIAQHLNFDGIEIFDAKEIARTVRALMRDVFDANPNQPGEDYLDDVQTMVRNALTRELMQTMIPARAELAHADKRSLEWLIRMAITLAYVVQTETLDQSDSGETRPDDDYHDARRLRQLLRGSLHWAQQAAHQGDETAQAFCEQASSALDDTQRLR